MKLWILRQINTGKYDEMQGCIVRAEYTQRARELAAQRCMDEGQDTWLSPNLSTCNELTIFGPEECIMEDNNNG